MVDIGVLNTPDSNVVRVRVPPPAPSCGIFSRMNPYCYFDGKVIPLSDAVVRPDDLGMLRGFAVYEGITAVDGIPFHFHEHFIRLEHSAAALELAIPYSEGEILAGIEELLQKNAPEGRASIRLILSGGSAVGGIEYREENTLLYALAEPSAGFPASWYTEGVSLITAEHDRFMPEYKTTAYITAVLLQKARIAAGAAEILYTSGDTILECATSNIFIVKDGVITTPGSLILKGITRNVAIELLSATSKVVEGEVTAQDLEEADEIFITSSFKDIVPVVTIDDVTVGGGVPGPVTQKLMTDFALELSKTRVEK